MLAQRDLLICHHPCPVHFLRFPLLGTGWATPLLQEAALKSRESAGGLWPRPTPLENTGTD